MTISRVVPGGMADGDKLTGAIFSAVDANVEKALDKRDGETDTLSSLVLLANGGRIVRQYQTGTDADGTYQIGNGGVIKVPMLTALRAYTLSTTGAVTGDIIEVWHPPTLLAGYSVDVVSGGGGGTLLRIGPDGQTRIGAFIFDGTYWKVYSGKRAGLVWEELSAGSWVVPADVNFIVAIGCGGGGGGGGGGGSITDLWEDLSHGGGSGGGGGGALLGIVPLGVTPGASHTVALGAGGAGGNGGQASSSTPSDGAPGANGGNTTLGTLATFYGAQGGAGGTKGSADNASFVPGGMPIASSMRRVTVVEAHAPQEGGAGFRYAGGTSAPTIDTSVLYGQHSAVAAGGAPGNSGVSPDPDDSPGGRGGGGGAGPWPGSTGGNGGGGGDGNSTDPGGVGSNGLGYGSGGGGGGGAGSDDRGGTDFSGGNGGAGNPGRLIVVYVR